jgi:hypothetical protein
MGWQKRFLSLVFPTKPTDESHLRGLVEENEPMCQEKRLSVGALPKRFIRDRVIQPTNKPRLRVAVIYNKQRH